MLDALVSNGMQVQHPCLDRVFQYPSSGLMRVTRLGPLRKHLKKAYDLVIYLNTFQNGMSFDNVVRIARYCGARVYEYQAGEHMREVKPVGFKSTKLYSRREGSAKVMA